MKQLYVLLVVVLVVLYYHLGSWGLLETSESRYAEISKEMIVSRDFLHPQLLDVNHFHKPPLTYYITDLGYKIAGLNEFGARFFLPIAIMLQIILVYAITNFLFNDTTKALTSALIYFSMPLVLISSRNLTTDAYLNTFVLSSVFFWLKHKENNSWVYSILFYVMLGLIFEIKGPIGFIFVFTFILLFKIINKEKIKISLKDVLGIIIFIIIAFIWYVFLYIENPNILDYFLKDQIANRVLSKSFNRSKPFWYFLLNIPLVSLPWIFVIGIWLRNKVKSKSKITNAQKLLLLNILVPLVLFSTFKTKLILYLLPIFGFIAILVSDVISTSSIKFNKRLKTILVTYYALLCVTFAFLSFTFESFKISFYTLFITTLIGAVSIYFVAISNFITYKKNGLISFIIGCFLLINGTSFLELNQNQLNSAKEAILFLNQKVPNAQNIFVYNYMIASAQFYTNKNVILLDDGHDTAHRDLRFETDLTWKTHLLSLKKDADKERLKQLAKEDTAIISRVKNLPNEELLSIFNNNYEKKQFGAWMVYYSVK